MREEQTRMGLEQAALAPNQRLVAKSPEPHLSLTQLKEKEASQLTGGKKKRSKSSLGETGLLPPFKPTNVRLKLTRQKEDYISPLNVLEHHETKRRDEPDPAAVHEERPLSPMRLFAACPDHSHRLKGESPEVKKKEAHRKSLEEDRKKQAQLARQPLPKQFGLPTNPVTGAVLDTEHFVQESPMFHDEQRDERQPIRTTLCIVTSGNRAGGNRNESEEDNIDTRAIAEITGMLESQVVGLLTQYVADMKRANRAMNPSQFKRFVKRQHFEDSMIIKRCFDIFDVRKAGAISFAELCVGLCFFTQHKRWGYCREDALFLDYASRFFDIDGEGGDRISKFKFYQVANCTLGKDFATEVTDAVWEIFSGTGGSISYENFQHVLCEMEELREACHRIMIVQSIDRESEEYQHNIDAILEATKEFRELKALGRIWYLDRLADEFAQSESREERETISGRAEEIMNARKGRDQLAASYYVKVFRHLMLEKDAVKYIQKERQSNLDALTAAQHNSDIDVRLRLEMASAILEAMAEAYVNPGQ